jgi:hypothetical protein
VVRQGAGVVWFLGFTPNHDLKVFENRAPKPNKKGKGATNRLLPSHDDYQDLDDERGTDWKLKQVSEALSAAVITAKDHPGAIIPTKLSDVVRVEVLVTEREGLGELHLRFLVPPLQKSVLPSGFE